MRVNVCKKIDEGIKTTLDVVLEVMVEHQGEI